MPTVADLRARRLDLTRASLRERLLAGDLDHARVVVESLAAGVRHRRHRGGGGGSWRTRRSAATATTREIPVVQAPPTGAAARTRRCKPARGRVGRPAANGERASSTPAATAMSPACSSAPAGGPEIRPGDLVGAITGEAGVESRTIGAIEIADGFSLVEVPEDLADEIIAALRATKIRGLRPTVRRDRG